MDPRVLFAARHPSLLNHSRNLWLQQMLFGKSYWVKDKRFQFSGLLMVSLLKSWWVNVTSRIWQKHTQKSSNKKLHLFYWPYGPTKQMFWSFDVDSVSVHKEDMMKFLQTTFVTFSILFLQVFLVNSLMLKVGKLTNLSSRRILK